MQVSRRGGEFVKFVLNKFRGARQVAKGVVGIQKEIFVLGKTPEANRDSALYLQIIIKIGIYLS